MGKLATIDVFIVVAYLIFMMVFGWWVGRFIRSDKDYFLAGRKLPWWAIGMSMVVSDIGALDIIGVAGAAYLYGITLANFEWIGCIPAMMVGAFIFIPFYWRSGVFSVPEFLGRRYNQTIRTLVALIQGIFMVFLLGIFFFTAAKAMYVLMGWNMYFSIIVVAVVVGIYTLFGGLAAVVYTDVAQCIIMFGGSAVILIVALTDIGGWGELVRTVGAMGDTYNDHFHLLIPMDKASPYGWAGVIFGLSFVLGPAYWIGNQAIVQRTLGARSEYEAKKSVIWGSLLKLFIPFILVGPGLAGIILVPGLTSGDDVYPTMVHKYLPPGLTGLVFAAFLAALMSSVDSYLNSASTLWTKDIYEALLRPGKSDRHYMIVGKILIVVFLVLGVSSAPLAGRFPSLYGYFQTIFSFIQGPLLSIIILGLLWRRTTGKGALAGLIGGVAMSTFLFWLKDLLFTTPEPFLFIAVWSFLASFSAVVIVSLLTEPEPPEKIDGIVFDWKRSLSRRAEQ